MLMTRQVSLRPDAELLVWCARTLVTDELRARIRQRVQAPLDWAVILDLAWYHGVGPLLHRNLSSFCSDLVPAEILTQLYRRMQAGALLNRVLVHELVVLCEALEAHGVPVMPIKGATLAAAIYDDPALREFRDLDLIVPEGSISETQAVLLALGYERLGCSSDSGERAQEDGPYYVFSKKRTLFRVDVQYVMTHPQFMFRLDRPEFWNCRRPVVLANKIVQGLSPEDLLIVLCLHGSKHAWEELKWICDVAELLRSHPHLDWDRIFLNASLWRCRRLVCLGLSLAHLLLDAPLPEAVLARFSTDSDVHVLSPRMPATLLADHYSGVKESQVVALHFSLKDSWWERWKFGLMLCRDHHPLVMIPPVWFRWRTSLSWLARCVSPLHWAMRRLLPSTIRGAINRVVEHSG